MDALRPLETTGPYGKGGKPPFMLPLRVGDQSTDLPQRLRPQPLSEDGTIPAGAPDGTTLSPESGDGDDGRDAAIDEYYAKLAASLGNTEDARNFADMMSYVTKELKDIDKMDYRSAHDKFAQTMANTQDKMAERGLLDRPAADKPAGGEPSTPTPSGPKAA